MSTEKIVAGVVAALLAIAVSRAVHAEPLRIRYGVWVGYGPLFIAQEKGFFAKEGVAVQLIKMDEHTAAFAAMAAGRIDAAAATVSDVAAFSDLGYEPLACIMALDESFGADGILATKDIRSSLVLLRGLPLLPPHDKVGA
jgi:NitT/TauT family transport system substrate-binding protein